MFVNEASCNFKQWEVALHALGFSNSLNSSQVEKAKCINIAAIILKLNRRKKNSRFSADMNWINSVYNGGSMSFAPAETLIQSMLYGQFPELFICKEQKISSIQNILLVFCTCVYTCTECFRINLEFQNRLWVLLLCKGDLEPNLYCTQVAFNHVSCELSMLGFFSVFLVLGTFSGKSVSEIIHSDFVFRDVVCSESALC